MTLEEASSPPYCLFQTISGSRAYGTHTADSDTDIRGVFIAPLPSILSRQRPEQVNNDTNDLVYYELGRYLDLLEKNNPNVLEMLFSPTDCILHRSPLIDRIRPELFLSKRCLQTFAGYAASQIGKARGLNKKIVNPQPPRRKGVLDFCHVLQGQGSVPITRWLGEKGWDQQRCGLVSIPHMRDVYGVYYDTTEAHGFRGVLSSPDSTEVSVSSIPIGLDPVCWMSFNKDGFKKHCKEWAEYQEWLECRNEARYRQTESHGQGYDAKNMMHTFRLLDAAAEIAQTGSLSVRVRNRDFLLKIKSGGFSYEALLSMAQDRLLEIEALYAASSLPEAPDSTRIEALLIELREDYYGIKS